MVIAHNVWMFSIPIECRRAKTCSQEQVESKLNCHCITTEDWWSGVKSYYDNGGGIKFDFSVESDDGKYCRELFFHVFSSMICAVYGYIEIALCFIAA